MLVSQASTAALRVLRLAFALSLTLAPLSTACGEDHLPAFARPPADDAGSDDAGDELRP